MGNGFLRNPFRNPKTRNPDERSGLRAISTVLFSFIVTVCTGLHSVTFPFNARQDFVGLQRFSLQAVSLAQGNFIAISTRFSVLGVFVLFSWEAVIGAV